VGVNLKYDNIFDWNYMKRDQQYRIMFMLCDSGVNLCKTPNGLIICRD